MLRMYAGVSALAVIVIATTSAAPPRATRARDAQVVPGTRGDFDGDGRADLAVFRPWNGEWHVEGQPMTQWGLSGDIPVAADWNGDGVSDLAVYRPWWDHSWHIRATGQTVQWGQRGDIPVAADYNGDGRTDVAVFRQTEGIQAYWHFFGGATLAFGLRGDVPVPADYDGDGNADAAVYRPSNGTFFVRNSSNGADVAHTLGSPGDVAVPADFDGDLRTDYAVFRPSTGMWSLRLSVAGATSYTLGQPGDVPVPQDLDGDGAAELVVWRPGTGAWLIYNRITGSQSSRQLGGPGDIPALQTPRVSSPPTADFDGDGRADLSIYRDVAGVGYWYQRLSANGYATSTLMQWGLGGDVPVPGDYDGDRRTDYAVFRPSSRIWYVLLSASNTTVAWNQPAEAIPVPADYDGDGRTDFAAHYMSGGWSYRFGQVASGVNRALGFGSTFFEGKPGDIPIIGDFDGEGISNTTVFRPSNGTWHIQTAGTFFQWPPLARQFGLPTDIPVPADFDGDGRTDLGLYRGDGYWLVSDAIFPAQQPVRQLGLAGDVPIPRDYDGDGRADIAVWRPSTGEWFFVESSTGIRRVYQWGLNGDQPVLRTR